MAPVKYHYFHRFFTNSVMRSLAASAASLLALSRLRALRRAPAIRSDDSVRRGV